MKHSPNPSDPSRHLGFLLHEVSHLIRQNFHQRAKELGLTQAQWRALAHLSRQEGINQVKLADLLEVKPITLARLIDKLEAAGWVERRPDPADRRACLLYLTPAAAPLIRKIEGFGAETRKQATAGLSAAQLQQLVESLCAMKTNLLAAIPGRQDNRHE